MLFNVTIFCHYDVGVTHSDIPGTGTEKKTGLVETGKKLFQIID